MAYGDMAIGDMWPRVAPLLFLRNLGKTTGIGTRKHRQNYGSDERV